MIVVKDRQGVATVCSTVPRIGSIRSLALSLLMAALAIPAYGQEVPQDRTQRRPVPAEMQRESTEPRLEPLYRERISNMDDQAPPPDVPATRSTEKSQIIQTDERLNTEESTEFQKFVFSSTGQKLPIFGHDLFRGVPTTFSPVDRVPATADYEIGPGDELLIRGWGQVEINYRTVVDRGGNIFIPKVGTISVVGIKFGQLQGYLKSSIEKVFRGFELSVTLGQLRSIQIFIVGHARRPGSYTVSSLTTLVNAIFASGGPSVHGSMRRIQLRRSGQPVHEFDIYDLLMRGDKSRDISLLPGDVILIPAVNRQVAIMGSVSVPGIYEIKENSTLEDLIGFAGGLSPVALGGKATVERIQDRAIRSVTEFDLNEQGLKKKLMEGDLVSIRPLTARFENAVTLRGNVVYPGRFPWKPGIRIRDVIPSKEFLITREYWRGQDYLGRSDETRRDESRSNVVVADAPSIKSPDDTKNGKSAEVNVHEEKKGSREQRLQDNFRRIIPEINLDYAVIHRFDHQQLTTRLVPFNLGQALADAASKENLELQAGDVITIFSQADIKIPQAKQSKFVRLEGEFNAAGYYEALQGETLDQLITRVGGLTESAYLFGSEFTRESVREVQQQGFDQFLSQLELEVERTSSIRSQNVVSTEEAAGLLQRAESQRRLIEKLRLVRASGRVVLGLSPQDNIGALPKIILEDGDRFFVPYKPAVVNVLGAVYNKTSFMYEQGKVVSSYLRQAGGGTNSADLGRSYIIRADGSVVRVGSSRGWFLNGLEDTRLMPGDTIVVPEKLDRVGLVKGLKDWSQIIAQFALGVAAINSITRP
jgi:polysaccharide biosynthesis/export protein